MPLHELERHEPLINAQWNEGRARAVIEHIITDTHQRFAGEKLWPIHPLDRLPEISTDSLKMIWLGAAGVIWALSYLGDVGALTLTREYVPAVCELLERNRQDVRLFYQDVASYLMGDVGILLLHQKLAPSDDLTQQLYAGIEANLRHPAREFMWGAPGTMLAALFLLERTGDARWKALFLRNCEELWQEWEYSEEFRCHLWTQGLYGRSVKLLGAVHGFAGNAYALIRGRHLLGPARRDEWLTRISETLEKTALSEGAFVNWPQSVGPPRPGRTALLIQHCHGAPGIINCLAGYPGEPSSLVSELLEGGGELTWAPVRW